MTLLYFSWRRVETDKSARSVVASQATGQSRAQASSQCASDFGQPAQSPENRGAKPDAPTFVERGYSLILLLRERITPALLRIEGAYPLDGGALLWRNRR